MTESSANPQLASIAGAWQLNPEGTTVEFHTKAMWGLAKVTGTFDAVRGTGVVGDDGAVSGELVFDAASIDTSNKRRDTHLRSDDFFDVGKYPTFAFTASEAVPSADGTVRVTGTLRIKDQSHPIELAATSTEPSPDRVTVRAEATIDRSEWGLTWAKMGARLVNRVVVVAQFARS